MAAVAAQSDIDGLARVVRPEADLAGYQVVDVRERFEVAARAG